VDKDRVETKSSVFRTNGPDISVSREGLGPALPAALRNLYYLFGVRWAVGFYHAVFDPDGVEAEVDVRAFVVAALYMMVAADPVPAVRPGKNRAFFCNKRQGWIDYYITEGAKGSSMRLEPGGGCLRGESLASGGLATDCQKAWVGGVADGVQTSGQ